MSNTNPLLSALGNYTGSTQTFPLLPGSPAINAGTNGGCPATDQRGVTRATCDIGAYESQGFILTKTGGDNQSTTISTAFAHPLAVTVTATGAGQVNGGKVAFTAPGSGASAVLVGSPFMIASGSASVTATANSTAGSYPVTVSATGASNGRFSLTNAASGGGGGGGGGSTPVNGACGSAHNGTFTNAPTTDLCAVGSPSAVSGTGPWLWSCSGSSNGTTASCSASIQSYTVTTTAGTGGGISPTSQTVNHGSTTTFTVTPNSGYLGTVGGTCGGTLSGTTYTTAAVMADCTVTASFQVQQTTPTVTPTGR